ncbi:MULTISPECIES: alkaline shock response membrane anchor protein AmaP [Streptomycetaceae]|uniref:Alkaline shock response membrane anchor protein AmaP n=1 Tax=Streptantibioticus cattleyicolor (strain ATCC 35852 / DSM 46488 / JCM 4925 / NBRC 14057 / NRRL 8057) TaxID=1003195 RepID=F8JXS9_STREN|nr:MULTISPECIES: alkaline shock response membrane anchor protein AmaP [Streptomycetaceae]AEW93396.1 hypothetical protein SCATT_10250 [Streptantibioticus cattleyicolor NRRL 8057 = DSM 46488]MYS58110.1 alkaline shock response membrane anchor protein AmaP [Streptomyces sp. SID5468]CCB73752.1 putative membrane protein [Streptantibioticus cattleyicolor NRRL 8057 = DSM 46488]
MRATPGETRAANRALLALTGAVLFAVGAAVLLIGFDLPRTWGLTLPSWWWPYHSGTDVLLPAGARVRYRGEPWWWPAVFSGLSVLALAALWWLLAQFGRQRVARVRVARGGAGEVRLRGRALEEALAADIAALPGVARARAVLTGRRAAPRARVWVVLRPDAEPAAVLAALAGEPLERARTATGLMLRTEVRMTGRRHRARRVA